MVSQSLAPCFLLIFFSCCTSSWLQRVLLMDGWRKFCQKQRMSSASLVPSNWDRKQETGGTERRRTEETKERGGQRRGGGGEQVEDVIDNNVILIKSASCDYWLITYINIRDFLPIMFVISITNQLLLLLPSDQSETENNIKHTHATSPLSCWSCARKPGSAPPRGGASHSESL